MTARRRSVARRPEPRTIDVELPDSSGFPGWWARVRVDFPARLVGDLNSGDLDRMIAGLEVIVLDHNMPDEHGDRAARLGDVDPYTGLVAVLGAAMDAIGKLPPR